MLSRTFPVNFLFPAFVILFLLQTNFAQGSGCALKLEQLNQPPELMGFRVGMTEQQVKTVEPLVQLGRPDEFGVIKTSVNPPFDQRFNKATYAGVRTISFDFLDGKLVTLWIGYEGNFKWPALDSFVRISAKHSASRQTGRRNVPDDS